MQLQHQKITLDVNDTRAFTVLNAHQGDSKTRFIDITLTENGSTITLSSNYVATVKASINNKTKAVNTAVVNTTNNVITVELTKTMLDTPGLLNCEVILQDNQQFVTSATFAVKVAESVISDESEIVASKEFGKLLDALTEIKDIEDKADRVQTLVDNIDKLKSANDIINRLSTSETNIAANKASIKELSELVQEVKNSAIAEIESLKAGKLDTTDFSAYKTSTDKAVGENTNSIKANTTAIDKCVADIASNLTLINQNSIKATTDKSTSIVLNDSSDCNIVNLICDSDNYNLSIYSKNLFNLKNTRIWVNDYVTSGSLIVDNNSINFDIMPGNFCGIYVRYDAIVKGNLLLDKSCVISLDVIADKDCKFRLRDENTNKVVIKNLTSNVATNFDMQIILNNSTKAISMYGIDITENTHIKLSNIMIELGSVATKYEDYKDFQSATQDTDLSTVHTNYPITTVISDSDFILTYVADTKNYIDNKFNELATALVAHESEVM